MSCMMLHNLCISVNDPCEPQWRLEVKQLSLIKNTFLKKIYFYFKFFLQQHKNIIKSNNKKNNYMNQLLRLPLLKYTHRKKNAYV